MREGLNKGARSQCFADSWPSTQANLHHETYPSMIVLHSTSPAEDSRTYVICALSESARRIALLSSPLFSLDSLINAILSPSCSR